MKNVSSAQSTGAEVAYRRFSGTWMDNTACCDSEGNFGCSSYKTKLLLQVPAKNLDGMCPEHDGAALLEREAQYRAIPWQENAVLRGRAETLYIECAAH